MTCDDFKQQAAGCALGALDPDEQRAADEHLRAPGPHHGCRETLDEAVDTVARLAQALPPVPIGEHVWRAIERDVRRSSLRVTAPRRSTPPRREIFAWTLAVAAILAIYFVNESRTHLEAHQALEHAAWLASTEKVARERDACLIERKAARDSAALERAAIALLELPATRLLSLSPQGDKGYRASAIVSAGGKRVIVLGSAIAPIPGKDFELWIIRGKAAPIPAGFLRAGDDGAVAGEIDPTLLEEGMPDAIAVSLEPAGGRPTPTEVLLVAAIQKG